MKNNQIHIQIKDGQVKISHEKPMAITDFLQVMSTSILAAMNGILNSVPEANQQEVKEDLYDMYNAAASNTLNIFAPDIEMRPHLTAQAILEAENKIINEGKAPKLEVVK